MPAAGSMAGQAQVPPKRYKVRVGGPSFPGPQPCPFQGGAAALQVTPCDAPCKSRLLSSTTAYSHATRSQAQGLPKPPEWGVRGQRAQRPRPMAVTEGSALSEGLSNLGLDSPREGAAATHPRALDKAATGCDSSGLVAAAEPASGDDGAAMADVPR